MNTEINIPINLKFDVDGETANMALYLVQTYCNKMGLTLISKRQGDGMIKLEYTNDWDRKEVKA